MEKLLEELKKLAKEHNKEITPEIIEFFISFLNLSDCIYKITNELKNDPNSLFNNYTVEDEDILLDNQKNYLKSLKIFTKIHNDKVSIEYIKFNTFIYDIISTIFLKAEFSKGLSHFYSLSITKDLLVEEASEITSELTISNLASYTNYELDSIKLKNKLSFSLIELSTGMKITNNRADKYIESIELAKSITNLNNSQYSQKKHTTQLTSKNQPITLIDFLTEVKVIEVIKKIQYEFKSFEGKRLAILIYILQEENKIISIISNSKTHSRKQFIQLFKEDNSFDKFQAVNKYINPFSNELNLPTKKEIDADYIKIKEKLTKIIENPVV